MSGATIVVRYMEVAWLQVGDVGGRASWDRRRGCLEKVGTIVYWSSFTVSYFSSFRDCLVCRTFLSLISACLADVGQQRASLQGRSVWPERDLSAASLLPDLHIGQSY